MLLVNKFITLGVNTFLLLITPLHVSMHKHHYQGFAMYSKVTNSIDVKSAVIYKCHNKVKRLQHHILLYRGDDKSLAQPTFRYILFDGENISFDASLVIYKYIYIYI